jgi:two-component system, LuxR family, sensor kinase FixL
VQSSLVVALLGLEYPAEQFRSFQTMMLALSPTGRLRGTIVSPRARAEAALRAKQTELSGLSRVMAIGAMGSALAHELSQPLAAIAAFAHGARRLVAGGATDREKLDHTLGEIAGQSQRAGEVLRQLRDFVAQGKFEPADVMLAPLIARAIDHVASAGLSARIAISVSCPAGLRVRGDALHLEHVILNLVRNAADALQGAGIAQGRIAVEAREAGEHVEIIVSDSGPGVSPALHDRLFEPFATGKTTGMGLGLAIGREIAEAHGGTLVHEESDGRGARFVLRLPTGREL